MRCGSRAPITPASPRRSRSSGSSKREEPPRTRQQLGREKFIERVWEWKRESGGRILQQLRVLGASCDWTRERFTMDEGLSRAVRQAFVSLYNEGLIYRATRLVNWDVQSQTVLSDLEVENEENVQGEMFEFAYPMEGGGEIVVSTTRPETMLGDTAVAVHPDDPRYKALHGKFALHPFVGRKVPIITDAVLVDPKFGTGAVKVTPAHDFNDFATGKRHQLEEINILNMDGTLNEQAGPFAGLERFAARKAVKEALEELGLARGERAHTLTLPRSQRSGTVVEPIISTQWFVKMKPLAEPAIAAVETGQDQDHPAALGEDVLPLAAQHSGLVHLAPAVVGPHHSGVVLRTVRAHDRRAAKRRRSAHRCGGTARARRGRARHLVQLRAVAVLDARLARSDPGPRALLSD